jgi:ABC-type sulfate transport system permease subunit
VTPSAPEPRRRERPLGVIVIALFLVLDAALVVAERAFGVTLGSRTELIADPDGRIGILITLLVILRVVAAVGLWLGVRRGWVLTMLLVGISLIVNLILYWNGQAIYHRMAIDVVLALYLNQGAVREWFEQTARAETAGAPASISTDR